MSFVHLCLPMRFEPGRMPPSPLGWVDPRTEPGELLWPALFDMQKVVALERDLGSHAAAGQLQQRPAPEGGGTFKAEWFALEDVAPSDIVAWCRFWDAAGTEGRGDWTVGTLMGKDTRGRYHVVDVRRGQWSSGTVDAQMKLAADLDRDMGRYVRIREEQEPGSSGKAVVASHTQMLAGYDYQGRPATGAKETRWKPFAVQAEARNVCLVRAEWNRAWLDEISLVPYATHDDQADSASGAFAELALGGGTVHVVKMQGY